MVNMRHRKNMLQSFRKKGSKILKYQLKDRNTVYYRELVIARSPGHRDDEAIFRNNHLVKYFLRFLLITL